MKKKDYETPVAMVIELKIESLLNTVSQGGNNDGNGDSRRYLWDDEEEEE